MTPEERYRLCLLQQHFYYDESSPTCLRWAVDRYTGKNYSRLLIAKGTVAGSLSGAGYYDIKLDKKTYKAHLIVWVLKTKAPLLTGETIDHFDRDSLNNKFDNLRSVSKAVNCRNQKRYCTNTSGYPGVYLFKNKTWKAMWMEEGRQKSRSFSVNLYGAARAKALAILERRLAIERLNKLGYGYSEGHGT